MKRITYLLFGIIFLLVACTSKTKEPAAAEPALAIDQAQGTTDDSTMSVTVVDDQAARPQFIMFTASW